MSFLFSLFKLGAATTVGTGGMVYYMNPKIRTMPSEIFYAVQRVMRVGYYGVMMGYDYWGAEPTDEVHEKAAKRLYKCFATNAGSYIKIGQMIGQLDLLVPDKYVEVFDQMCNQAPTTSWEDVRAIILEDFGKEVEDLFDEFETEPIASASLAQVHRAKLKGTDEKIAVKVQHRWIKERVPGDLRIIEKGIEFGEKVFPDFKYGWFSREMRINLPIEIDFRNEAVNAKRAKKIFEGEPNIVVPAVYDDYTTERVLTMSFEEGTSIGHVRDLQAQGIDVSQVSYTISRLFNDLIFRHGFVHADPHPGNVYVRKDENGKAVVVLLDHGSYQELDDKTRLAYTKLWRGILEQNKKNLKEASTDLGVEYFELFTAMVSNRTYDDVMEEENRMKAKK